MRLATSVPFAEAAELIHGLLKVEVDDETVRRLTERAGKAAVAVEEEEREGLVTKMARERASGGVLQLVSVDGAMVRTREEGWTEVKTLAIGQVARSTTAPTTNDLSYFSRLADHRTFSDLARLEFHRRRTANAEEVVAVTDGAVWIQGFLDDHCPEATRIIDWWHAAHYLGVAGQALFGAGSEKATTWLELMLEELAHGDPEVVVGELGIIEDLLGLEAVRAARTYLQERMDKIRYRECRDQGLPIGSGSVESANKTVVEVRLKRAGCRWAVANVDPMLTLRTVLKSHRWDERWPALCRSLQPRHRSRATTRPPDSSPPTPAPVTPTVASTPPREKTIIDGRPTRKHPWNKTPAVRPSRAKL